VPLNGKDLFVFPGPFPALLTYSSTWYFQQAVCLIAAMKDTIYIILAILCAALTFFFLVKKMKDDCIP
jgi:hypothetical protein